MRSRIGMAAAAVVVLAPASAAFAQCAPSFVEVEVVADSTPGCAVIAPADALPQLNITNNCGEDQFHVEGGVDCPHCGPPLTLRPGTFGSFVVNNEPITAFTPASQPTEHVLSWARGNDTGELTVRATPHVFVCPDPDMGSGPDMQIVEAEPPPAEDSDSGCATVTHGASRSPSAWWALVLFAATRLRKPKRQQRE